MEKKHFLLNQKRMKSPIIITLILIFFYFMKKKSYFRQYPTATHSTYLIEERMQLPQFL